MQNITFPALCFADLLNYAHFSNIFVRESIFRNRFTQKHVRRHFFITACDCGTLYHWLELCKEEKIPKIQDYYGSGWVGSGLTRNFVLENHPKIPLKQYRYFVVVYHVFCLY